jgi:RNA polymerase sigma-70 factor (ECF subfamily)
MPADSQINALYVEHHGWLRGWLRKKLGNSFDAADIAHDTFLRVLSSGLSIAGEQPRALLTHIAKGLVVDFWRRQDVEKAYADAIAVLPEQQAPSEEARLLIVEALMRLDAMLKAMAGPTREVFLLAQVDELPYAAIAQRLDISLATVNRHMRRAYIACLTLD